MKIEKVHSDSRGSIYSITGEPIKLEEYSLLETKANIMRGGCLHKKHSETIVVLEGEISYFYRLPNEVEINEISMRAGDSYTIPPNSPHYMLSLTDSIVMEFGADIDEKKVKHDEFRKVVMEHNQSVQS